MKLTCSRDMYYNYRLKWDAKSNVLEAFVQASSASSEKTAGVDIDMARTTLLRCLERPEKAIPFNTGRQAFSPLSCVVAAVAGICP